IQGTDSVASMVVMINGLPANSEYRRFKIKTVVGADDFASMSEVILRRFTRARNKDKAFANLPDLVVIDGGKGQLSSAHKAMAEAGFDLPMIGLAKRLEEIITLDGKVLSLSPDHEALKLLRRIRDEAHRFAVAYHRSTRSKKGLKSLLENIPGIGKVRQKNLYRAFGSVEKISRATIDELTEVKGMNLAAAQAVRNYFDTLEKS
ncbi:MAG TPA: helix-hairpin-helix domain-containing protein, partial [Clostridia bacterium]|nr:helix-hairpin-helix domain-containing protein [Clostridia bacterium]